MKQFFKVLSDLIDSWAQARSATILAKARKYEEAKSIYGTRT